MYKFFWGFETQTDHLISALRPDLLIIIKKRICRIVNFAVPVVLRVKFKESEKKNKYVDLARELKKQRKKKVIVIPTVIGALGTVTKRLVQGHGNKRTSGNHPDYRMFYIIKNTEKSPRDLRKLVVTQTPVKDHHPTLRRKTFKE